MAKVDDGGPAFPDWETGKGGMSLRDYIAAHVAAVLAGNDALRNTAAREALDTGVSVGVSVARMAYELADCLLAERAKDKP